jgi:2-polyprenyl-6-methoxyphenol hydroxylase-like FAD-dependent oxidoreductase
VLVPAARVPCSGYAGPGLVRAVLVWCLSRACAGVNTSAGGRRSVPGSMSGPQTGRASLARPTLCAATPFVTRTAEIFDEPPPTASPRGVANPAPSPSAPRSQRPSGDAPVPSCAPSTQAQTLYLRSGEIQTIIWTTGLRPDLSWLDAPIFDRKGRVDHDGGVTASSGLYLIGMPFLRRENRHSLTAPPPTPLISPTTSCVTSIPPKENPMDNHYDVIVVVGGRVAGAATAMLLARSGLRVLVIEAARQGTDTLSTHALMRGGVTQLHRWGLLDAVIATGTPANRATQFTYGDDTETIEIRTRDGISALRAPRRTVLDALLLDAAREAGAEIRSPARVTRLLIDRDIVRGVEGITRGTNARFQATATITVGADGRGSMVADAVDAEFQRRGTASGAIIYGYFPGLARDRYHWAYRPGVTAGVVPTGDGLACIWAGTPTARFDTLRPNSLETSFRLLLAEAAPKVAQSIAHTASADRLRGFPGVPGYIRSCGGPGWALVGDAGYYKDPITAHGITDALRDAELLARAVLAAPRGRPAQLAALRDYQHIRNRLSEPLFDVTERIASYQWDLAELREHLLALSQAMQPEVDALLGLDRPDDQSRPLLAG